MMPNEIAALVTVVTIKPRNSTTVSGLVKSDKGNILSRW